MDKTGHLHVPHPVRTLGALTRVLRADSSDSVPETDVGGMSADGVYCIVMRDEAVVVRCTIPADGSSVYGRSV